MSSSPTGSSEPGPPRGLRAVALAAAAAALLLLSFPGALRLRNPDEPRDCEIGREFADGTWTLIPRLNGDLYWSKPPLFHLSVGGLMAATGSRGERVAKAAGALWGVACVAATAALAETLLGAGTGLLAALLLLSTQYFLLRFRISTTDTALAALTTVSLLGFFRAHGTGRTGWWLLMGAAAGLAALAKGLHGLLFPFLVAAVFLAVRREGRALLGARFWMAAGAGAAVAGAWLLVLRFAADAGGGPDLLRGFLLGNLERRFGEQAHHEGGPFHYLVLLLRGLPWTFAAAAGAWSLFRPGGAQRDRLLGPLLWVVVVTAALSLATGKRTVYLLPVLPAVALLAAGGVDAAARGVLGRVPDALARWPVEFLSLPVRPLSWFRADLRRRAAAGAALLAVGNLAWILAVLGPVTAAESGEPLARKAASLAGDRPLVLFRLGQGDVGQFLFPLDRTLPRADDAAELAAVAGGRPVVILAEAGVPEASAEKGRLPAAVLARWRLLGEGKASRTPYRIYEWDGR